MRTPFSVYFLLAQVCAFAAGYADLTGSWRESAGDNPQFSRPDYDDHAWRIVTVPLGPRGLGKFSFDATGEYFWLRRTVDLQSLPGTEQLAITVGAIGEAYQIFVDGKLVGDTGRFVLSELQVARPRIFALPPEVRGPRVSLAIRVWNAPIQSWTGLLTNDTGPWLITPFSLAPHDADLAAIDRQRYERLADFVQPMIVLLIAVIVLLIWAYERRQTELLWLGLYLVVVGGGRLHNYLQLNLDSHPFGSGALKFGFVLTILPAAILAKFVTTSLGSRWLMWPVLMLSAAGVISIPFSQDWVTYCLWAIEGLTLTALLLACLPPLQTGPWRGSARRVLAAILAFIVYTHASGFGRIGRLGLPVLSRMTWPFTFSSHVMTVTLFAFAFTLILLRRLLRDRDERVRLSGELEAARTVQQLLLPASRTTTSAYETMAVYEPAQEVGGDFFWTRELPGTSLLLAVGDVSGKGLKAAMLVSVAVGALRNERSSEPAALLAALNASLVGHTGGGFVTCLCARFDPDGRVTLANAGHLTPWMNGTEVTVEPGLPLGVVASVEYATTVLNITAGSQMTLISDGVVEAASAAGELFGFDRTREISGKTAQEISDAAKAWGQNDDITVVTVRKNA